LGRFCWEDIVSILDLLYNGLSVSFLKIPERRIFYARNRTKESQPIPEQSVLERLLDYLVKTTNGMAFGLFATLIIGVIITQIGSLLDFDIQLFGWVINIGNNIMGLGTVLKGLMGVGIGIGVAWSMDLKELRLSVRERWGGIAGSTIIGAKADPLVIYITVVATVNLVGLILKKKTSVDIIIIPLLFSIIGYLIALIIYTPVYSVTTAVGLFINNATTYAPFFMWHCYFRGDGHRFDTPDFFGRHCDCVQYFRPCRRCRRRRLLRPNGGLCRSRP
jgi:hypothetical protein